ncbi:MAG: ABC transporter substrate-binding protein [Lachnospirales bacterium]
MRNIIFIMLFFLCGCSSLDILNTKEEPTEPAKVVKKNEVYKDKVVIGIKRTYTLNPLTVKEEHTKDVLSLLFTNIAELKKDNTVELVLGESYTYNPETNTGVLVLKDVLWQDGLSYVSSNDVIYSLNCIRNDSKSLYFNTISNIKSYGKVDDKTVQFTLYEDRGGIPYFLLFPVIPSNHKNLETIDGAHFENVIGNGFYKVSEYGINGNFTLEDNPYDDFTMGIKEIDIIAHSDSKTQLYSFEEGLINFIQEDVSAWSKYHDDRSVNIVENSTSSLEFIGFNYSTEMGNNLEFRKLVESIINFQNIIHNIYLDFCDYAYSTVQSNHFAYNKNLKYPKYDIDAGKDFLLKTGYNGEEILVLVNNENAERMRLAEELVSQLNNIGVKGVLVALPYEDYIRRIDENYYHILVGGYNIGVFPNYGMLLGDNNIFNYTNDGMRDLLWQVDNSADMQSLTNNLLQLQQDVNDSLIFLPVLFKYNAIITDENIKVYPPTSYVNAFYNINEWILE